MSNVYLSSPYSSFFFDLCQDAWRLASTCVFLGTYCGASCLVRIVPRLPACMFYPAPLATYSYSFCFFHQLQGFVFLCASFLVLLACYALRGEALRPPPCTPHPLVFLTDAPCDLLLFLWLFPSSSSSTMWVLLASYVCHATHCRGEGTVRPAFML